MIIICLEGCHGCGKTELCRRFAMAGFDVLDEAFLDMPEYMLHPQSLLMETTWVCAWFKRILQRASELKAAGRNAVFIADRSPYSAVFYAANKTGSLLEPVIRAHMQEVRAAAGIEIYTVYLRVERELLWSRIQARLRREPGRVKYNEDKREWMESTLSFYNNFKWDMFADNNDITLEALRDVLIAKVAGRSPRFTQTLMAPSSPFSAAARAACSPLPRNSVASPTSRTTDASPASPTTAAATSPPMVTSRVCAGAGAEAGAGVPPSAKAPAPVAATDGSAFSPVDHAGMAALRRASAIKRKGAPGLETPDSAVSVALGEGERRSKAANITSPLCTRLHGQPSLPWLRWTTWRPRDWMAAPNYSTPFGHLHPTVMNQTQTVNAVVFLGMAGMHCCSRGNRGCAKPHRHLHRVTARSHRLHVRVCRSNDFGRRVPSVHHLRQATQRKA